MIPLGTSLKCSAYVKMGYRADILILYIRISAGGGSLFLAFLFDTAPYGLSLAFCFLARSLPSDLQPPSLLHPEIAILQFAIISKDLLSRLPC